MRGDNVIFVSITPDANVCSSSGGGRSWIYALNRTDGGAPNIQVFDRNGDGEINSNDFTSGSETSAVAVNGISSNPSLARGEDNSFVYVGNSNLAEGNSGIEQEETADTTIRSRVRWRQLH